MNKAKKWLSLLLCVVMLFAVMTGCGDNSAANDANQDDQEEQLQIGGDIEDTTEMEQTHNYANAYATFDPEEVVMTANGKDIHWKDFFYFIEYYITYVEMYTGTVTDWSAELTEGTTYQDYVVDGAAEWMKYAAAVEANADTLGAGMTEEDEAEIQAQWDSIVEQYGTKEAFIEQMGQYYCTEELYNHMLKTTLLGDKCLAALYGENGSNLTDEQVAEYIADDGYLRAKHILISKTYTDDEGNEVEYTEEEMKDRLALANDILSQLKAASPEELPDLFDTLMNQYSEDPGGLLMYPDGYLFVEGDMVTEFYEGTLAIEIGQISELVETPYGYHIIYRLPLDFDATPQQYSSYYVSGSQEYTLRALTAKSMFDSVLAGWTEAVEVTYTDVIDKIDLTTMLAFG